VVLVVLLFLTRPLGFLPSAVLSAIVFMIGVKLIDTKGMRELFRLQRNEFWIALLVAATVVVLSVIYGIVVAVVLSLIDHVRHDYRPRTRVLVRDDAGRLVSVPARPNRVAAPGLLVYRFEADLFYANANLFMEQILHLVSAAEKPICAVILDASGIDNVDYSAAKMLLEIRKDLAKRDIAFSMVATEDGVLDDLRRYGLADDHAYATVDAALTALRGA
jgi:MFS superfamily sulfate permease-like transporter